MTGILVISKIGLVVFIVKSDLVVVITQILSVDMYAINFIRKCPYKRSTHIIVCITLYRYNTKTIQI